MKNYYWSIQLILFILLCTFPPAYAAADRKCVILLHGLGRSHRCMAALEYTLKRFHYVVVNQDYPSTSKSIKDLAAEHIQPMINACREQNATQINFVTHSLGGIILQQYLMSHEVPGLGRIVMLSPPNHGSQAADVLQHNWVYRLITGPAGQELTTNINSTPNQIHLGPKYQIGVIAGTFSYPFGNIIFHEPNDGAVAVSSTRLTYMKDFITLPVSHAFIRSNTMAPRTSRTFVARTSRA